MGDLLANPRSERIKRVRALAGRSARQDTGLILVEGPQAVREAVRFAHVRDVYFAPDAAPAVSLIVAEARERGLHAHPCAPEVMEAISKDCQGIAAVARAISVDWESAKSAWLRQAPGAAAHGPRSGDPFVAVLWQARDPGNVGTVIRAADAAGAAGVILTAHSAEVQAPKVVRATAGSLFHLPIVVEPSWQAAASQLREAGFRLLATAANGSHALFDPSALGGAVALVFGNEARGLPPEVLSDCDGSVSIPIFGAAESLNLAMAATVSLYQVATSRRDS